MSVIVYGMEMPDCGYVCLKVFANGEVLMTKEHRGALVITGIREKVGTAVSVPPHGPLIDSNRLIDIGLHLVHTAKNDDIANGVKWLWQYIIEEPVIIEADTAEEGE